MNINKQKLKAEERELAEWLIDQYVFWTPPHDDAVGFK